MAGIYPKRQYFKTFSYNVFLTINSNENVFLGPKWVKPEAQTIKDERFSEAFCEKLWLTFGTIFFFFFFFFENKYKEYIQYYFVNQIIKQ